MKFIASSAIVSIIALFALHTPSQALPERTDAIITCENYDDFFIWIFNDSPESVPEEEALYSASGVFYDKTDGDQRKEFSDVPLKLIYKQVPGIIGKGKHYVLAGDSEIFESLTVIPQMATEKLFYSTQNGEERVVYLRCHDGHR